MQSLIIGLRRVINGNNMVRNSIYHAIARVSTDSSSGDETFQPQPVNLKERKNDESNKGDRSRKAEFRPVRSEPDMSAFSSKARSWFLHGPGTVLKWLSDAINEQEQSDSPIAKPMSGPFGKEVSRVLGGGLRPGSLVLIGGNPGVGKSTLALQLAEKLAQESDGPVMYVSGEESIKQIANRASRMRISAENIIICLNTFLEDIIEEIGHLNPRAIIIDSIQTTHLRGLDASAGSPSQMKECMVKLRQLANKTNIPIIVIGHVTKQGEIAGPHTLKHIVDVVLLVEADGNLAYIILRPVKNRYASTDEVGIFVMSKTGLQVASVNHSEMFSRDNDSIPRIFVGRAIDVVHHGHCPFPVNIEALCISVPQNKNKVFGHGVAKSRADQIVVVLTNQACIEPKNWIFLNVLNGVKLSEPAGDLAIAAAICSSYFEWLIPIGMSFIGEVGLDGKLRTVSRINKMVRAVANLGYKKCIVPTGSEKFLADLDIDMEIVYCQDLTDMIEAVFVTKGKKDQESSLKGIDV